MTATECKSTTPGRRGSVRAQHIAQGRKPGVAGCVRCALGTIVAAALLVAAPAFAQERSIWALVVNDEPKGDVEILLTADGPWVDPSALVAAGVLKVPDGRRQVFAPDTVARVSLASLAPQITFTLDEAEIRLIISADPALLTPDRARDLQPAPARMEGQLEQRLLPELFRELVDRRHDHRLRRTRRASLRRAVPERRQRRRHTARSRPD